jgi:hypothetical protein
MDMAELDVDDARIMASPSATQTDTQTIFAKIGMRIGEKQTQKRFTWHHNMAELNQLIVAHIPDSNQKRHLLRLWTKIVQRLGL